MLSFLLCSIIFVSFLNLSFIGLLLWSYLNTTDDSLFFCLFNSFTHCFRCQGWEFLFYFFAYCQGWEFLRCNFNHHLNLEFLKLCSVRDTRLSISPPLWLKKSSLGDFPGSLGLRLHIPNAGDLGSVLCQATKFHMPQVRVWRKKNPSWPSCIIYLFAPSFTHSFNNICVKTLW